VSRATTQPSALHLVEKPNKRVNTKRVPAALSEWEREDVRRSFRAGRSAYQIGKEHSCAPFLVLEFNLRELTAKVRDLELMLLEPPPMISLQRIRPKSETRDVIAGKGKVA
jgi:hypothetical protein